MSTADYQTAIDVIQCLALIGLILGFLMLWKGWWINGG